MKTKLIFSTFIYSFFTAIIFLWFNSLFADFSVLIRMGFSLILAAIILALLILSKTLWRLYALGVDILKARSLVFGLAKTDFKNKFAGSYFGIAWAFVMPLVLVAMWSFVFQFALGRAEVGGVPFALWLVAGITPWFYFSESWLGGNNALLEYSYLVKKVVFKIDILPVVKVISSAFVHVFFLTVALILFVAFGMPPSIHAIQLFYYLFAVSVLIMALNYLTSAITVFFRDFIQLLQVLLQLGVWYAPILWSPADAPIPERFLWIFRINPMYYIVSGYRDSFINGVWFFERPFMTFYFWALTIFILIIGTGLYGKMKPHYADVL